MIRLLVLLCLSISLYGVALSELKNGINTTSYMEYIIDKNNTDDLKKIEQEKNWKPLPRSNLGYMKYPVWTKFTIFNDLDKKASFFLKNPRPGMDKITVYILENNGKIVHKKLGDTIPFLETQIKHNFSLVRLRLEPKQSMTIYAKLSSIGPTEAGWIYHTFRGFMHFTIADMFWWGVFSGTVVALIIYYLTLYYILRFSFILAYISMGFWSLIFQLLLHGFFRFETFGVPPDMINILNWFSINLMLLSMFAFGTLFFNMRKTMPKINIVFLTSSLLIVTGTLFFSPLGDPSIGNTMVIYVSLLWYFVLIFTGIWAIKLKLIGAWYYVIGQGIFSATIWIQNLSFAGIVDIGTLISYLTVPIGTLIDLIFLSLAMGSFIKKIKRDKQKLQLYSLSQSKFNTIGKNYAAMLHQWKTPVARLGTTICEIESHLRFGDQKRLNQNISPNIQKMYQYITELENILEEFGSLFKTENQKQHFKAQDIIYEIIDFLLPKIDKNKITINTSPTQDITLYSYKSLIKHIYLTLLENAIDILIERNIKNPRISIEFSVEKGNFITSIEDNGGGIKQKPIESIFTPFESGKLSEQENYYGLGLMVAKMITEDKLKGNITVKNRPLGALFTIIIPI